MTRIGHAGLTLSTSIGACLNAGLLFWFLKKRGIYVPQRGWTKFLAKQAVALTLLAVLLVFIAGPESFWLGATIWSRIGRLSWVIVAGAITYFGALWLLGFRLADFNRRDSTG